MHHEQDRTTFLDNELISKPSVEQEPAETSSERRYLTQAELEQKYQGLLANVRLFGQQSAKVNFDTRYGAATRMLEMLDRSQERLVQRLKDESSDPSYAGINWQPIFAMFEQDGIEIDHIKATAHQPQGEGQLLEDVEQSIRDAK